MILTALFKLIELLTVKPNNGSRPPRRSNPNQKGESNENVSTHSTGSGTREGVGHHGRDIRGSVYGDLSTHSRDDRHFRHGLFIPFHDD